MNLRRRYIYGPYPTEDGPSRPRTCCVHFQGFYNTGKLKRYRFILCKAERSGRSRAASLRDMKPAGQRQRRRRSACKSPSNISLNQTHGVLKSHRPVSLPETT